MSETKTEMNSNSPIWSRLDVGELKIGLDSDTFGIWRMYFEL